jgi:hypothetical protein
MDFRTLKDNIIPQIEHSLHDWVVVSGAYEDLLNIYTLVEEKSKMTCKKNLFKLLEKKKYSKASKLYLNQSQIITMLKSFHIFSNIFITRFLIEITNDMDITLWKFVHKQNSSKKFKHYNQINPSKLLSTYCIINYRNKLVSHHNVYRGEGASINGIKSKLIYFGISKDSTGFPQKEVHNVDRLKKKYVIKFPVLEKIDNYNEISEFLFYNIPIGLIGTKNEDRLLINNVIESSGVKSLSFEEIINSIDEFIHEFVRILKNYKD